MLLSDMATYFLKQKIFLTLAFLIFAFSIVLLFPKDSFAVAIDGYGWAKTSMSAYSSNRMVFKTYSPGGSAIQADSVSITMVDFPDLYPNKTYTCSSPPCPSSITISGIGNNGWFVYSDVRKAGYHEVVNAGYFDNNIFTGNNDQLNFNVYATPNAWSYNARLTVPTDSVWLDYEPTYTVSANPSFGGTSASVRMFSGSQGPLGAPWPQNFTFGTQGFSEGSIGLAGYMFDNLGADSGMFQASYGLDKTPPIVSCSLNPSGNQPYTTTSTLLTLTEGDPLSGVAEGDVDVSINGGVWGDAGLPNGGATVDDDSAYPFDYLVSAGNTYEFRYRARDNTINNVGVGDQWSNPAICGTILVDDYPSPELIFTRQWYDNSPTAEGIISSNYPPASTFGSREFFISNQVRLHGYVKNLGLSIPSGTTVEICFYANWDPSGSPPGSSDNCSGGDRILLNVNFTTGTSPNWDTGETYPFGSACADVNGDGVVSGLDFFALLGHFGEQYTDPLAPAYNLDAKDYDLNDDGIVSGLDNFIVNNQNQVVCTRDSNFTTSAVPGDYEMVGWVDQGENVDESAVPGGEGNNQASDPYTVCCASGDISVAVNPTQVSIRPSEVIEPAASATVTWGSSPGSWKDSAIMQLDLSVPATAVGMTAVFTDIVGVPLGTSMSFRKDATPPSIPINIATLNTVENTYQLLITASASQTSPVFSASDSINLDVLVGPKAWAKTTGGDVGSMDSINLPPSVDTFSRTGTSNSNNIFHYPSADPLGPHVNIHTFGVTNDILSRIGRVCTTGTKFYGRSYFNYDTSPILSSSKIISAELRFKVEQLPTNDFDVGLYRYDWQDFAGGGTQSSEDTWHDTISNPVSPAETFSKTDLPAVDEFYTLEITDFDIFDKGADTKLYMKPTNEPAQKAWGCDPAVSSYVELQIGSPSLVILYANAQYFNGEYLAIADGSITQFLSSKDWLVKNYEPQPGDGLNYPELLQGDIYKYLWDKFGSGRSETLACGDLPSTSGIYECEGDFVYIGELGTNNVEAVVFITGNMTIAVNLPVNSVNQKIIFVVNGNITVPASHNFPPLLNTDVVQINGFFITNGTFTSEQPNLPSIGPLNVNGGVIAQTDIVLERDLGTDCMGDCNQDVPAEKFDYDPSYLYLFARVDESLGHSLLGEDAGSKLEEVVP